MSLDVEPVRRWDVAACEGGARQLFGVADALDQAYERLRRAASGLGDWRGSAAGQALPRVGCGLVAVSRLAGLVRQAADSLRGGLAGLAEAVRLAVVPAQSGAEAVQAAAAAAAVDRRIAAELTATVRSGQLPASRSELLPRRSWTPADVAGWWTALPPHLRRLALTERPAVLGALSGLPASVRDAANRRLLAQLLRSLRAERDRQVAAGFAMIPTDFRWVADSVRTRLTVAETVERELAALERGGHQARLLTLDLQGAGRVAIGVGDVDIARHVAVVVPGMGQDAVRGIRRTVGQAVHLRKQAGQESTAVTAVVAWIGYAAPGWAQVPFTARALLGGRALAADLHALSAGRTVDGRDPPHLTLVGHSYGSTVVGAAATTEPLLAEDLVLLGSPGVLAGHASELGRGPGHVFVGEARLDPIADLGAFGADPGEQRFGATVIRAEPGPGMSWRERLSGGHHSHYYDPGSESLRNVARVVVGRSADVTEVTAEGER